MSIDVQVYITYTLASLAEDGSKSLYTAAIVRRWTIVQLENLRGSEVSVRVSDESPVFYKTAIFIICNSI